MQPPSCTETISPVTWSRSRVLSLPLSLGWKKFCCNSTHNFDFIQLLLKKPFIIWTKRQMTDILTLRHGLHPEDVFVLITKWALFLTLYIHVLLRTKTCQCFTCLFLLGNVLPQKCDADMFRKGSVSTFLVIHLRIQLLINISLERYYLSIEKEGTPEFH